MFLQSLAGQEVPSVSWNRVHRGWPLVPISLSQVETVQHPHIILTSSICTYVLKVVCPGLQDGTLYVLLYPLI
jgi:hypothetical protein